MVVVVFSGHGQQEGTHQKRKRTRTHTDRELKYKIFISHSRVNMKNT